MDHLGLVASLQVPEDGGVVEEGQVDHVLALLKLGRVDSPHLRGLVGELLVPHSHHALAGGVLHVPRLQQPLSISASLGIRNPDGLLGVVGLLLVRSLHLDGGQQELRGVGVHGALHQLDMAGHDDLLQGPVRSESTEDELQSTGVSPARGDFIQESGHLVTWSAGAGLLATPGQLFNVLREGTRTIEGTIERNGVLI